jgi:hypothetical protein
MVLKPLVLGGVAILGIALTPILAGFGTAGIAAGSAAAAAQSSIGAVAGGSLFATLQSWGMLGYYAIGTGAGVVATALGLVL